MTTVSLLPISIKGFYIRYFIYVYALPNEEAYFTGIG